MAHYAFINAETNLVEQVIVGRDEDDNVVDGVTYDWEEYYGNIHGMICRRTSYNTKGGVHEGGGTPFRKNYAGIGYLWDSDRDAFIPPKPYESWVLNETTCVYEAPIAYPDDGGRYVWDEDTTSWVAANDEVTP